MALSNSYSIARKIFSPSVRASNAPAVSLKRFLATTPSEVLDEVSSSNIDQHVISSLANAPLPGVSVHVVKAGAQISRSYGVSRYDGDNVNGSKPVTATTVFPIGSLSKNFTALSIMQLVRDGKLELDAPVATYLPNVHIKSSEPVTIRHLLSHTSGIREFRGLTDVAGLLWGAKVPADDLKKYYENSSISTAGAPGQIYLKSHHNYGLLTLLLQEVSNLEVRDYFRQKIFKPLGMSKTDLVLQDEMKDQLTDSFRMTGKGATVLRKALSGSIKSAQGGYSSGVDMMKYISAMIEPETQGKGVVDSNMLDEMLKPVYRVDPFLPGQGLSFNVQQVHWKPSSDGQPFDEEVAYLTAGQGMTWAGFQSAFAFSRKLKTGVCVMSNCGTHNYEVSAVASKVLKEAIPQWKMSSPAKTDAKTVALKNALSSAGFDQAALWPKLVGFYQLPLSQMLSARMMWLLGGELQVYQWRGQRLEIRSIFGPLATNWVRTGKGKEICPSDPENPLHYSVNAPNLVFSTPVRGTTDLRFDPENESLHIGMVTLHKRPWYLSMYYPLMAGVCYGGFKIVGKARAFDIFSHATLLAPI